MEIGGVAGAVTAQTMAMTQATLSTGVMRRVLDMEKTQAAMLVQMLDAQNGLGANLNTLA